MTLVELKSPDPIRQHLYRYGDSKYSLVNLTVFPMELDGSRATDRMPHLVNAFDFYRPNVWELAQLNRDGGVDVLERFESVDQATIWITRREAKS